MGLIVTQESLAIIVGVTLSTIIGWEQDGMPLHKLATDVKPASYDTATVVEWRVNRELEKLGK